MNAVYFSDVENYEWRQQDVII